MCQAAGEYTIVKQPDMSPRGPEEAEGAMEVRTCRSWRSELAVHVESLLSMSC